MVKELLSLLEQLNQAETPESRKLRLQRSIAAREAVDRAIHDVGRRKAQVGS